MTILSNTLFYNDSKSNMLGFIKTPILSESPYFRNAMRLYNRSLASSSFSKILPTTAISSKLDTRVLAQSKPVATLLGSRFSCVYPKLVTPSALSFQITAKNHFSLIKREQSDQAETLSVPLSLADRITLLSIPSSALNTTSRSTPSEQLPIQSFREEKLIRWVLTSHDVYGLAVTVLHNFFDICYQKPGKRNFINDSLVPRVRYTGFTFSATAGAVYHIAIGILFTPLVVATLGQKKEINKIWYGYWAGASISAMSVFAGMFGIVSGNYLIHKTMEKRIPLFKRLLARCLWHAQKICTRLNRVDFSQLRQEVENIKTTAEMLFMAQKLTGVARRDLLSTMVL